MLTFYPNKASKLPIYRQLYLFIKEQIQTGQLKTYEKMPSKRELSNHLKLSQVTIDSAYQQLVVEGYLLAKRKSGFYVEPYDQLLDIKATKPKFNEQPKARSPYELAFQTNVIDDSLFPQALWAKLTRETLGLHKVGINQLDSQGLWELRLEIAKYLKSFRGIACEPEQIILGAGSESLLSLIIPLLGTDKRFAMENPGYPKISQIFLNWGLDLSYINLDHQGVSIEDLSNQLIDVVHVTPSHQFPTGIVMPLQRRLELLNWAKTFDHHYIIEDDYDSEFRYVGQPIPALQSLDQFEKVIYMNSFSKSLAPSLRISYMVLPFSLLKSFHHIFRFHSCTVPYFDQWVLAKFIEGGYFERHLNQMRKIYRNRLTAFQKHFQALGLGSVFTLTGYDVGLHFLMSTKVLKEEDLIETAKQQGILLRGLQEFAFKPINYPSTLVVGYAGLNEDQIKQTLTKLKDIWANDLTNSLDVIK